MRFTIEEEGLFVRDVNTVNPPAGKLLRVCREVEHRLGMSLTPPQATPAKRLILYRFSQLLPEALAPEATALAHDLTKRFG